MKSHIDMLFDSLKKHLIQNYPGPKDTAELLIDICYKRCREADSEHWKDRRQYMHVRHEKMTICVSSSIEHLDDENILGLFLHEIGHIITDEIPQVYLDALSVKEIKEANSDDPEIVADNLIEKVWGITIRYDRNKVQWVKLV